MMTLIYNSFRVTDGHLESNRTKELVSIEHICTDTGVIHDDLNLQQLQSNRWGKLNRECYRCIWSQTDQQLTRAVAQLAPIH